MAYRLKVGRSFEPGQYSTMAQAKQAAAKLANDIGEKVSIWDADQLPSFKAYSGAVSKGRSGKSTVNIPVKPGQAPANKKRTVVKNGRPMSKAMAMRGFFKNPTPHGNPRAGEHYFIDNLGNYITDKSLKALMRKAQKIADTTGKRIKIMEEDLTREKKHQFTTARRKVRH